jgi:hypothetical protein
MKLMERILMERIRILEAISPTESHRKIDSSPLHPVVAHTFQHHNPALSLSPCTQIQNTTQQCAHNLPDDMLGGAQFFE